MEPTADGADESKAEKAQLLIGVDESCLTREDLLKVRRLLKKKETEEVRRQV